MNATKELKKLVKKTVIDPIFDELYEQHEQRKGHLFFAKIRQKIESEFMKTQTINA